MIAKITVTINGGSVAAVVSKVNPTYDLGDLVRRRAHQELDRVLDGLREAHEAARLSE